MTNPTPDEDITSEHQAELDRCDIFETVKTYDLEQRGTYEGYGAMEEQLNNPWCRGDYVKTEDYIKLHDTLTAENKRLREAIERTYNTAVGNEAPMYIIAYTVATLQEFIHPKEARDAEIQPK